MSYASATVCAMKTCVCRVWWRTVHRVSSTKHTAVHIHTHTYIQFLTHIYIHSFSHTHTYTVSHSFSHDTHIYTCTYIHTHAHTEKHIHIYTRIYIHIHLHMHIHLHIHTHTHIHIYIYIHIHSHTHTLIHIHTLHTKYMLLDSAQLTFTSQCIVCVCHNDCFLSYISRFLFAQDVADSQHEGDWCNICWTEVLGAAPCVRLTSCGHVFHYHCVQDTLQQRWPSES